MLIARRQVERLINKVGPQAIRDWKTNPALIHFPPTVSTLMASEPASFLVQQVIEPPYLCLTGNIDLQGW